MVHIHAGVLLGAFPKLHALASLARESIIVGKIEGSQGCSNDEVHSTSYPQARGLMEPTTLTKMYKKYMRDVWPLDAHQRDHSDIGTL
jgi:hypothetical protein